MRSSPIPTFYASCLVAGKHQGYIPFDLDINLRPRYVFTDILKRETGEWKAPYLRDAHTAQP
jgi:hypothetical protein